MVWSWHGAAKWEVAQWEYCEQFNSLASDKFEWNFRYVIFKWILVTDGWGSDMNVTGLHWWSVNIGSGDGLVPSGNKPLPEPMLTQIYVAKWHHQVSMS